LATDRAFATARTTSRELVSIIHGICVCVCVCESFNQRLIPGFTGKSPSKRGRFVNFDSDSGQSCQTLHPSHLTIQLAKLTTPHSPQALNKICECQ
jgi:hypothetical protein